MKLYALILSLVFLFSTQAQPQISPPEPDHYRLDSYRAPVPLTLAGAKVISTAQAFDLWKKKYAVFIDALPHAPKPEGLPASVVWREPIRNDIPGSLWLADTGYGLLADVMLRYFEEGLIKATAADKDRPLVFYCLKDCWMSWNAAKRALIVMCIGIQREAMVGRRRAIRLKRVSQSRIEKIFIRLLFHSSNNGARKGAEALFN